MVRRIAAFIFILTVAGNVWAGVCECISGSDHAISSCCKRKLSEQNSVAPKPCCEDECGQDPFVSPHRTQNDAMVKIPLPSAVVAEAPAYGRLPFGAHGRTAVPAPFVDLRISFPRPPNLYIRHSSFLI